MKPIDDPPLHVTLPVEAELPRPVACPREERRPWPDRGEAAVLADPPPHHRL